MRQTIADNISVHGRVSSVSLHGPTELSVKHSDGNRYSIMVALTQDEGALVAAELYGAGEQRIVLEFASGLKSTWFLGDPGGRHDETAFPPEAPVRALEAA